LGFHLIILEFGFRLINLEFDILLTLCCIYLGSQAQQMLENWHSYSLLVLNIVVWGLDAAEDPENRDLYIVISVLLAGGHATLSYNLWISEVLPIEFSVSYE
jgi:hypothetical protein